MPWMEKIGRAMFRLGFMKLTIGLVEKTEDFSRVAQNVYFYLSKFLQNERKVKVK